MGSNFVFGCLSFFYYLFSTQNQVPPGADLGFSQGRGADFQKKKFIAFFRSDKRTFRELSQITIKTLI